MTFSLCTRPLFGHRVLDDCLCYGWLFPWCVQSKYFWTSPLHPYARHGTSVRRFLGWEMVVLELNFTLMRVTRLLVLYGFLTCIQQVLADETPAVVQDCCVSCCSVDVLPAGGSALHCSLIGPLEMSIERILFGVTSWCHDDTFMQKCQTAYAKGSDWNVWLYSAIQFI